MFIRLYSTPVRYELLLQTGVADAPFDPSPVDAALDRRGAVAQADGSRSWTLPSGQVEVRRLLEGGVLRAFELRIPLSDKLDLVRDLVTEGAALAEEAGVKLYDPQLSRTLSARDDALVADQYLATARYAGEMMGVPEAVSASFAPADEGLKPGTKVLLGIVIGTIVLYFFVDRLLGL